ncbi:MAG: hypothetical protein R8N23_05665 [Reichenbachiella sp.]|uniref:hypothetical protein n=1 Tax=Reichenbachiella sp. TaxID=2184521 RepID=UPI0029676791|nr:hypothetical protein [Reichenbachiella sp.]MDW3209332.1 hypothetical protein [Reichenbachiella sp.]
MLILLFSCGTKDISKSYETSHANRLLSSDSQKEWSLVSRMENGEDVFGPCSENNTLTFVNATVDSLYIIGKPPTCGSPLPLDTLYQAKYTVDGDNDDFFLNSISLTEEQHQSIGSVQVGELTSTRLSVSYTENGNAIEESYIY